MLTADKSFAFMRVAYCIFLGQGNVRLVQDVPLSSHVVSLFHDPDRSQKSGFHIVSLFQNPSKSQKSGFTDDAVNMLSIFH